MIRIVLALFLLACGRDNPKGSPTTMSLSDQVSAQVEQVKTWAPTCAYKLPDGSVLNGISKDTCEAEGTGTGDGDVMAYAGYLCFAGVELGCETSRASQDENGRFWRSPARVGNPQNYDSTFSRDMFLGVLFYLVGSKDIESALRYQAYLSANNNKLCESSEDNRCTLTPNMWGLMGETWKYLGLPRTAEMAAYSVGDDSLLVVAAETVPMGYQAELVAVQILLRQKTGTYTAALQQAAKVLQERDPGNPFFVYVYEGRTDRVLSLMSAQIPPSPPAIKDTWSIARPSNELRFQQQSMGWEWIFLHALLKE